MDQLSSILFLGLMAFLGPLILMYRLNRSVARALLRHPVFLDVSFTVLMFWIHWGSFAGLAMATMSALFGSIAISFARWRLGYRGDGKL